VGACGAAQRRLTAPAAPDSAHFVLTEIALGAGLSLLVSLAACRALISAGLLDAPRLARQAHHNPTPTSGGVGVGAGYAAGIVLLTLPALREWTSWIGADDARRLALATSLAFTFLLIGFIDDTHTLGPKAKFAAFALAALGAALGVGAATELPIGLGLSLKLGLWLGILGSALWVFTLVNTVNFMDGANGLAMGSVAIGLVALAATSVAAGAMDAMVMALCGAAALIGFLVWNFPSGRLFAGDSGALFAGGLAAIASLIAIRQGGVSPFIPPLLFFPLLADTLLTLAWRVSRKRNMLDGHAEHLYQVGLRAGLSHAQITLAYWAAALQCSLIGFLASVAARVGESTLETASPGSVLWGVAGALTFLPIIAFTALVLAALQISRMTRRLAVARGLDGDVS
jgi:UDP-GlcNAc:undecaprenyl-phosphate/decaprenyl-phosphate GlcNAc-1-phosphate transferase